MNFEIAVDTYIRLSAISQYIRESIDDEERKLLRCVRLENKGGHAYAIASNRRVAAIYYLGTTTEADGAAHLNIDEALLKQCETEKAFNSKLHVVAVPELGIVSLKTTLGFNIASAGFFSETTKLKDWHTWGPSEMPTATKGAMAWLMWDMEALNRSAPSGRIAFPEFIDAHKPIVLRDIQYENWMGLFMSNLGDEKGRYYTVEPASFPEWW